MRRRLVRVPLTIALLLVASSASADWDRPGPDHLVLWQAPRAARMTGEFFGGAIAAVGVGLLARSVIGLPICAAMTSRNGDCPFSLATTALFGLGVGMTGGVYFAGSLLGGDGSVIGALVGVAIGAALAAGVAFLHDQPFAWRPPLQYVQWGFAAIPAFLPMIGYELTTSSTGARIAFVPSILPEGRGAGLALAGAF